MGGLMDLSIVVPVFNEEESVPGLHREIVDALSTRADLTYEVIYVDDGSSDSSLDVLKGIASTDPNVSVVELSRNFGQTAAMYAGFQSSRGRVIVPLDADGQNDPQDILRLVDRLDEGFECVSGWRANRQDKGLSRRLPSAIANRLIVKATGVDIHDSGCTIKAYDGDLLRGIPLYGEMHRLIPFYVHLAGGKVTELPVNHRARTFGSSKYGIGRTFRVIQDITVAKVQADFARRPMHLFGNIGALLGVIGIALGILALVLKLTGVRDLVETPLLVLASLFVLAGLQLVISGLLAEIMIRRLNLGADDRPYRVRAVFTSGSPAD
jgi:glycosyltransferase involved in cell wall biosynthesis